MSLSKPLRVFYIRPLSFADLDAVTSIEHCAFPPGERFSREDLAYHLRHSPGLCLGMFSPTGNLLGQAITTRTSLPVLTDSCMTKCTPSGSTIALVSFAVAPAYQRATLGTRFLEEYLSRMSRVEGATRVALIARKRLVKFYERFGFRSCGMSRVKFAGGGWLDLVFDTGEFGD
jgi:ribosomal protein S18 acetylase RimI-like enzyme